MKHTKLLPLALALAMTSGNLLAETAPAPAAAPALPPEVTQAIEAINQASDQVVTTVTETTQAAGEAVAAAIPDSEVPMVDERLLSVGLGAIAGVVVFNLATGGLASVPVLASMGGEAGAAMGGVGRGAVAISRVYAVTSAVVGGLVGDYMYRDAQAKRLPSVPAEVAARVTP